MDGPPLQLPIFPLGSVLFPGGLLPLRIFEPRYVAMTRACIRERAPFGVALIRAGYEVGRPAIPCELGCTARIVEWSADGPERYTLLAQGETVFRLLRRETRPDGLIVGEVDLRQPPDPVPLPARYEPLAALLLRLLDQGGAAQRGPRRIEDAAWVGYRLAELLPVPPEHKQRLLETAEPLAVLGEIEGLLQRMRPQD